MLLLLPPLLPAGDDDDDEVMVILRLLMLLMAPLAPMSRKIVVTFGKLPAMDEAYYQDYGHGDVRGDDDENSGDEDYHEADDGPFLNPKP